MLAALVLEQLTNSSQALFSLPLAQAATSFGTQVAGISRIAFTCLHAPDPPRAEGTAWALCLCLEWRRPAENTVLSVGFFCRVVYCTSRLPSAPPGAPSARWQPRWPCHTHRPLPAPPSQAEPVQASRAQSPDKKDLYLTGMPQGEGGDVPKISLCQLRAGASASRVMETPSTCCVYCVCI